MNETKPLRRVEDLISRIKERIQERQAEEKTILTVSAGTCGRARGSLKVIAALEKAIEDKGIANKVKVRISGCHGFCEAEPNIIMHPQGFFYQHVEPEHGEQIIAETVLNQRVIDSLLYADPVSNQKAEKQENIRFY